MPLPSRENNPFFPLVADYGDLTSDGQRKARLALLRSWWVPGKPDPLIADPEAFVYAFRFFKEYYRKGFRGNKHRYFYEDAPMHREWPEIVARHRHTLLTAFRGSAKTTFFGEELPEFLLVTRDHTPVQYGTAAQDLAEDQVKLVARDLEFNELIIQDFGILKGRKPLRWSTDRVELSNGSVYVGVSSEEVQRGIRLDGLRPFVQILDDPEVDKRVKNPKTRSDFEDWLVNVFFHCGEAFAWRVWSNTLLAQNAWAMRAMAGKFEPIKDWFKIRYDAAYRDAAGRLQSTWEAKYSRADIEAMQQSGNDRVMGFGKASFDTEMMNNPTSKFGVAFDFDPVKQGYHIRGSRAARYLHEIATDKDETWSEFLKRSVLVAYMDTSMGYESSDPSAIVICALDSDNVLWVLDCWYGLAYPTQVVIHALDLCEKWKVAALGMDTVVFEKLLADQLRSEARIREDANRWTPQIVEIPRSGGLSKEMRILALQFRFSEDLFRIRPNRWPDLEEQITKYTMNGAGTPHDDILECVAGCQEILRFVPDIKVRRDSRDLEKADIRQAMQDGVHISLDREGTRAAKLRALRHEARMLPHADGEEFLFLSPEDAAEEYGIFRSDLLEEEPNGYDGRRDRSGLMLRDHGSVPDGFDD